MKLGVLAALACSLVACSNGSRTSTSTASPAPSPAAPSPAALPSPSSAAPPWPTPPGWRTEVIPFPLDFAPTIAHRGEEELRFPPGFFDPASGDYWSYTFVWRTDDPAQLDATALGAELTAYFRGLIAAVDKQQRIGIKARDQILARATPDADGPGPATFRLAVHVFDAFKTAAPIDLTGWAERRPCRTGALWIFVLAPARSAIRPQLDELARAASCTP
jgi:hypothetical protein